jgi:hypothetical protein
VKHLRDRGRVRFPIEPLALEPEGRLPELRKIARERSARISQRSLFDVLSVEFGVPVRVTTPWGPTIVFVSLRQGWGYEYMQGPWRADRWTCTSRAVGEDLLKIRATAQQYHYLLVVLPDAAAARRAVAAVRRVSRALRTDLWTLKGMQMAVRDFQRDVALGTGNHFSAVASSVSKEYAAFEEDWNGRREISSEHEVPLTAAQRRAGRRLARILGRTAENT